MRYLEEFDDEEVRKLAQFYARPPHVSEVSKLARAVLLLRIEALEVDRIREERQRLRDERDGSVWIWQGDDEDHIESLVCPVLMSADQVRDLAGKVQRLPGLRDAVVRERDGWDGVPTLAAKTLWRSLDKVRAALDDVIGGASDA